MKAPTKAGFAGISTHDECANLVSVEGTCPHLKVPVPAEKSMLAARWRAGSQCRPSASRLWSSTARCA